MQARLLRLLGKDGTCMRRAGGREMVEGGNKKRGGSVMFEMEIHCAGIIVTLFIKQSKALGARLTHWSVGITAVPLASTKAAPHQCHGLLLRRI